MISRLNNGGIRDKYKSHNNARTVKFMGLEEVGMLSRLGRQAICKKVKARSWKRFTWKREKKIGG